MRSPFKPIIAATAVLASAGALGAGVWVAGDGFGDPPPEPGTAHLWVDASGGTCTRSDEPGEYTDADACGTFKTACEASQAGDTVLVKDGTYGQEILNTNCGGSSGNHVIFDAAPGEVYEFASSPASATRYPFEIGSRGNDNGPKYVTFRNLNTAAGGDPDVPENEFSIRCLRGASDIRFENLDVGGPYIEECHNITISGGDIGPCKAKSAGNGPSGYTVCGRFETVPTQEGVSSGVRTTNLLFEDLVVHDFNIGTPYLGDTDIHWECGFLHSAIGMTLQRSVFYNCGYYNISMGMVANAPGNGMGPENYRIINNFFGRPTDKDNNHTRASALNFSGKSTTCDWNNTLIAFNSFAPGTGPSDEGLSFTVCNGFRQVGNIRSAVVGYCFNEVTEWAYNVYRNGSATGTCSGTGEQSIGTGDFPYVKSGAGVVPDFHIMGDSWVGDGLVPSTHCGDLGITEDFDGDPRSGSCDAGADER